MALIDSSAQGELFMKIILIAAVFVCSSMAEAKNFIIYGEDNRQDVNEINNTKIQRISKAIAGRVSNYQYNDTDPKEITFDRVESLSWSMRVCSDQRFATQPTVVDCTGFLIGEDILVTAGHCIDTRRHEYKNEKSGACGTHSWLFDYKTENSGNVDLSNTSHNNLYKCKRVIYSKLEGSEDYAIIQLERKVKDRQPLKIRTSGKISKDQEIFVMGHPSGLPLKFAGDAKVFSHHGAYFSTNLDTFGGNSGSPVFNAQTHEVEGILVRGNADYVVEMENGRRCRRVNVCDENRENCKQWSEDIDGEHVSVIDRILAHI